ncbi:MAG: NAD(P)-dependent oxidoreductase [Betaproteobacteria bacterium]|nr:NAD(P)-dependent oxidoreductase [Betaproteobacteria bacterium]
MPENQHVGVVGVGQMGMAVAKRLLERGYAVHTRDIRADADAEAREAGATVCDSPAALAAACRVVVTLVVNEDQTEDVVFGARGVAETLGSDSVLMVSSTVSPTFIESLATRLAERGLAMLDAPMSGGPARARAGTISMMIAGPDAAMERAGDALETLSNARFAMSARPGDGARMKLVNNMLAGVNLAGSCEAMALGVRLGLDPQRIFDVVMASSGGSWIFGDRMPRVLSGDYRPRAAATLLTKDVSLALGAAREAGFPAPVAAAALQVFLATVALGHGAEDDAALVKFFQSLTGIALPERSS